MALSKELIQEFKKIHEKEYGEKLTDAEASEAAHNLINFFDLLLKIDYRDKQRNKNLEYNKTLPKTKT